MKKIDENTKNKLQKQPLILRKYLPKMGYDPEKMKNHWYMTSQLRINNHQVKTIERILNEEKRKKSIGGENK